MTPDKRVRLSKHVFSINTVLSNSKERREALEQIQQVDDCQWNDCLSAIKYAQENGLNETNFSLVASNNSAQIMDEVLNHTFHILADRAFAHQLEAGKEISTVPNQVSVILFGRNPKNNSFEEIFMDDRAQNSVSGLEACKRYCSFTNTPIDLNPKRKHFKLGAGIH